MSRTDGAGVTQVAALSDTLSAAREIPIFNPDAFAPDESAAVRSEPPTPVPSLATPAPTPAPTLAPSPASPSMGVEDTYVPGMISATNADEVSETQSVSTSTSENDTAVPTFTFKKAGATTTAGQSTSETTAETDGTQHTSEARVNPVDPALGEDETEQSPASSGGSESGFGSGDGDSNLENDLDEEPAEATDRNTEDEDESTSAELPEDVIASHVEIPTTTNGGGGDSTKDQIDSQYIEPNGAPAKMTYSPTVPPLHVDKLLREDAVKTESTPPIALTPARISFELPTTAPATAPPVVVSTPKPTTIQPPTPTVASAPSPHPTPSMRSSAVSTESANGLAMPSPAPHLNSPSVTLTAPAPTPSPSLLYTGFAHDGNYGSPDTSVSDTIPIGDECNAVLALTDQSDPGHQSITGTSSRNFSNNDSSTRIELISPRESGANAGSDPDILSVSTCANTGAHTSSDANTDSGNKRFPNDDTEHGYSCSGCDDPDTDTVCGKLSSSDSSHSRAISYSDRDYLRGRRDERERGREAASVLRGGRPVDLQRVNLRWPLDAYGCLPRPVEPTSAPASSAAEVTSSSLRAGSGRS
ncbi:hypothetical protein PybrP1_003152 [[Pythium] brassicae (nom. inval.)]|nr:hypothetical protein PybrP1_003152 [[Pythium] brassicae (nom. inval.)]